MTRREKIGKYYGMVSLDHRVEGLSWQINVFGLHTKDRRKSLEVVEQGITRVTEEFSIKMVTSLRSKGPEKKISEA